MRNRLLTWGLLAVLAAMSLALGGCGNHAASGSKSAVLFDPAVARADTPEAIDAELATRFEKAKKAAPGWDVYALEHDWRAWIANKEIPKNPDAAFIGFCKQRFQKKGKL